MVNRCIVAITLALSVALSGQWVSSAEAQTAEELERGRLHYEVGRTMYQAGRFSEAAREFQSAYDVSRRPELLYNIYVANRDAGNDTEAAAALRSYLALGTNIQNRPQLEAVLRRFDSEEGATETPTETPIDPATVATEATANEPSGTQHDVLTHPVTPAGPRPLWPWILAGGGGAMILVSVVTGIAAMGERNSLVTDCDADGADDFCPPSVDVNGRRSTISALATTTDVLLFGGITVAAAGVVLALVLPDDAAENVSASCGPGFCGATLSGSF